MENRVTCRLPTRMLATLGFTGNGKKVRRLNALLVGCGHPHW